MPQNTKTFSTQATIAGIHLSGPNNPKTALTILKGIPVEYPLSIKGVYEKIGSFGKLFSDERLVNILQAEGSFAEVFVDCPLTPPPCISCQQEICPGIWSCENIEVAYILALTDKSFKDPNVKKKRYFNPQAQRIWDVIHHSSSKNSSFIYEPTYNSNVAPLMVRAQSLQKRLKHVLPQIELKETSVFYSLVELCSYLGLQSSYAHEYKKFETGLAVRTNIVHNLLKAYLINPIIPNEILTKITTSVEVFQSLITAIVAALHHANLSTMPQPSEIFHSSSGFVFTPKLD